MTVHERSRMLASAAYDGEMDGGLRPELDAHLAGCGECRAFAAALDPLTGLVAVAPRERAPWLAARVLARLRARRRLRWAWTLAPGAAVAAVVVMILVVSGAAPLVPAPAAGAAAPLATLRTLYVERDVTEGEVTYRERVWFRAPADLRVERTVRGVTSVEIRRPGEWWTRGSGLVRGLPPEIVLPEPLSPTVALLGRDTGPGPVLAGTPTRRYELALARERRVAYVATGTLPLLGEDDVRIVVRKDLVEPVEESLTVVKRVLRYEVDGPVDPALFVPPRDAPVTDAGFRATGPGELPVRPVAAPRGFSLVTAGRGPSGGALLYARGALPVLVTAQDTSDTREADEIRPVDVGGRPAVLLLDLYAVPAVRIGIDGRVVTVSAPLPVESLVALAAAMFPAE